MPSCETGDERERRNCRFVRPPLRDQPSQLGISCARRCRDPHGSVFPAPVAGATLTTRYFLRSHACIPPTSKYPAAFGGVSGAHEPAARPRPGNPAAFGGVSGARGLAARHLPESPAPFGGVFVKRALQAHPRDAFADLSRGCMLNQDRWQHATMRGDAGRSVGSPPAAGYRDIRVNDCSRLPGRLQSFTLLGIQLARAFVARNASPREFCFAQEDHRTSWSTA